MQKQQQKLSRSAMKEIANEEMTVCRQRPMYSTSEP